MKTSTHHAQGAEHFAPVFGTNLTLAATHLGQNSMGTKGVKALTEVTGGAGTGSQKTLLSAIYAPGAKTVLYTLYKTFFDTI